MCRSERRSSALNWRPQSCAAAVAVEGLAKGSIAGDGAGLQQGLEFPRLGPPAPVRLVGRQRPHQRAVAPLGPEVHIDHERVAGDLHDVAGGAVQAPRIALADEHHVDVAGVVELGPAQLPHADDGQPVALRQLHQAGGGPQYVGGQRRDGGDGGGELIEAEEVARRDAQVLLPLPPGQPVGRGHAGVQVGAAVEIGQDVERGGIVLDQAGQLPAGGRHGHHRRGQATVEETAGGVRDGGHEALDRPAGDRRRGRSFDGVVEIQQEHAASVPRSVRWYERTEAFTGGSPCSHASPSCCSQPPRARSRSGRAATPRRTTPPSRHA